MSHASGPRDRAPHASEAFPEASSGSEGCRLLLVEDEPSQRRLLADILRREGFEVESVDSGEAALEWLEPAASHAMPELLLCDWRLPGMDGGALIRRLRQRQLPLAIVVMTAYGSIAHAVEAIRIGADDYLAKPFEREALLITVRRALRTRRLERENLRLRLALSEQDRFGALLGRSPGMQGLYRTLAKVAATDVTVLIEGESGTGKELVARTLHQKSARASGPFVAVNCAAIPEALMESEIFGHEKGAFTGAIRRREGRFEEASGGTLFLDEIASMPLGLQATLLRVLQERTVTPLGARGEVAVNARVVAASNQDLSKLVREGRFREDLFYRLNVVPVRIPPLRDRLEDLPLLSEALLERAARRHNIAVSPLTPALLGRLMRHSFPGNVRELANLLERLVLLSEGGELLLRDLPEALSEPASSAVQIALPREGLVWDELERSLLQQALERTDGNRTRAAGLLGLSYKTFLYRLEKFGLSQETG